MVFGKLRVVGFGGFTNTKPRRATWYCVCECGKETLSYAQGLINGNKTSCGCIVGQNSTTHGLSRHPIYRIWIGMKTRCYQPSHHTYEKYGARGIRICKRWLDFQSFYDDMADGWKPGLTIERKNGQGDYEPSNCEWATVFQQNQNTSANRYIEFNGKRQTIAAWMRETGIRTLAFRLDHGWSIADALTIPVKKGSPYKNRKHRHNAVSAST